MRLKLSILTIIITALIVGTPYYLDARIPRATAVVQIHPEALLPISATGATFPTR